ncbi:hypothetical protein ACI3KX_12990 [Microbacterium sp. ZW CA_36]|uniref:hypothetical protein n=1 Tax=Microbacterium sp. ZW CA_36 TaxID=3378078 RepID=UPI003853C500
MKRWWIWVVAAATVAVAAWASYVITVEIIARKNMEEFANRPELENWTLPYLGTEGPATVAAVCVAILVVAVWVLVWALRTRAGQRTTALPKK